MKDRADTMLSFANGLRGQKLTKSGRAWKLAKKWGLENPSHKKAGDFPRSMRRQLAVAAETSEQLVSTGWRIYRLVQEDKFSLEEVDEVAASGRSIQTFCYQEDEQKDNRSVRKNKQRRRQPRVEKNTVSPVFIKQLEHLSDALGEVGGIVKSVKATSNGQASKEFIALIEDLSVVLRDYRRKTFNHLHRHIARSK